MQKQYGEDHAIMLRMTEPEWDIFQRAIKLQQEEAKLRGLPALKPISVTELVRREFTTVCLVYQANFGSDEQRQAAMQGLVDMGNASVMKAIFWAQQLMGAQVAEKKEQNGANNETMPNMQSTVGDSADVAEESN